MSAPPLSSPPLQLDAGDRLGPYEIQSLLGAGGMGEVYRARDPRLDRVVAIKVLPARSSENPESRQRFEREARAISSLTHPHICTIYDTGDFNGRPYLVMELLEGETLSDRIARGPIAASQAARIGAEICEALDAAHRQHIVHRDLKPGNVMLTKSGVKLLDFGLAKLRNGNDGTISGNDATVRQITSEGTILGTLQYMAPEQVEGKEADSRTDIFAAGVVLYEMLTGKRPFTGTSQASVAASIVHSDPPPIAAHPALERIIRPCLAKDPDERWQTARDVALQLKLAGSSTSHETLVAGPPRSHAWVLPALAGLIAGSILALLATTLLRSKPIPREPVHLSVVLPEGQPLALGNSDSPLAISPDGRSVLYAATEGDTPFLYHREFSSRATRRLAGTEWASEPFFKPDGSAAGFVTNARLKTIALGNGTIRDLGPLGGPGRGATWLEDGTIMFVGLPSAGLTRIWPETGKREKLTTPAAGEGGHVGPWALPGGRHVLFTSETDGRSFDEARIEALELATKKRTVILEGGTHPRFVPPGRLYFTRGDALLSVPFDPATLTIKGTPSTVVEPVLVQPGTGAALYDVAPNGTIAFVPYSSSIFNQRVLWSDRKGNVEPLPLEPRRYIAPRISPNGKKLLIEIEGANDDLWISDLARGTFSRLTFAHENLAPVWSADSQSVIFAPYSTGLPNIHVLPADGSGVARKIVAADTPMFPSSASADGRWVGAISHAPGRGWDVVVYPANGGTRPHFEVRTPFNEGPPDFSPDGRWITYSSEESGRSEIYVQSLEQRGEKIAISTGGGSEPRWSPDGREIFYRNGDAFMTVAVSTANGFSAGAPQKLFERKFETMKNAIGRNYDVTPDGQRFVFIEGIEAERTLRRIDVVLGGRP